MKISMQTMLTLYTGYLFSLINQTDEFSLEEGRNAMKYLFNDDEKLFEQITHDMKNWNAAINFLMSYFDMELGDETVLMLKSLMVLRDTVLSEERTHTLSRFHMDNLLASYRNISAHIYELAVEAYGSNMVDVYPVPADDIELLELPTVVPENKPNENQQRFIKWLFDHDDDNPEVVQLLFCVV